MFVRWTKIAGLLVAILSFAFASRAGAQTGNTTTSGLFGTNTVGGSAASRTPAASSQARTSTGTSPGGTTGGTGATNTQNVASTAMQNMAGASNMSAPVAGGFVGADSSDTTNVRSLQAIGMGSTATNGSLTQLQSLFTQGLQTLNQNNARAPKARIRVPMKLGFSPLPASPVHFRTFGTNLTRLPGVRFVGPAEAVLEGRTAVLRGKVASEEDRRLAESLAKLEPEVLAVRNELTVDSVATTGEELPAAPQSP
jgi:hypothetical protein